MTTDSSISGISILDSEITKEGTGQQVDQHGIHFLTNGDASISNISINRNKIQLGTAGGKNGSYGIWLQAAGEGFTIDSNGLPTPRFRFYNFSIKDNEISYTRQYGISVTQAIGSSEDPVDENYYNYIEGNEVHDNGPAWAGSPVTIGIWVGRSSRVIIANNRVYDNEGWEDVPLKYGYDNVGIYLDAMTSESIIRNNIIYGHNSNSYRAPFYSLNPDPEPDADVNQILGSINSSGIALCCGAHDNEIYYNISYGNTVGLTIGRSFGIEVYDDLFLTHVHTTRIYNNVFAHNEVGIVHKGGYVPSWLTRDNPGIIEVPHCEGTGLCNELKNNIIFNNKGISLNDDTSTDGFGAGMWTLTDAVPPVRDANIFYGNDSSAWPVGENVYGTNVADPLFVDPDYDSLDPDDKPDFHLLSESPAIDGGTDVGLTLDLDGNPVPCGSRPDIGAYETYSSSSEYFDVKKAKVKWYDGLAALTKIKISGELSLPCGDYYNVNPVGSAKIGIAGVTDLINEPVTFVVHGNEDQKWKYKEDVVSPGIKKFKIDWQGAKFQYDQDIRIESVHIGYDAASIEIDRKEVTDPLTVAVGNVTVSIDAQGAVSVQPETVEFDVDEDGEIEVELPFTLAQDMVFTITQGETPDTIFVGDYYTFARGKYKVTAYFDEGTINGDTRPATLDLEIEVGDQGFIKTEQIAESEWNNLTTQKWKYKDNN